MRIIFLAFVCCLIMGQSAFAGPGLCRSNASSPSWGEAKDVPCSTDLSGNQRTTLGTRIAGENVVADRLKVETPNSQAVVTTAATTVVKSGLGFLHTCTILGGVLGAITIYDNTAASGTVIVPTYTPAAADTSKTIILDTVFSTGLTIVTAAATILHCSYR